MIAIYTRIFMVSRRLTQAEQRSKPTYVYSSLATDAHSNASENNISTLPRDSRLTVEQPTEASSKRKSRTNSSGLMDTLHPRNSTSSAAGLRGSIWQLTVGRISRGSVSHTVINRTAALGDCKATKTLGVIMGAFIVCWLPFFITAIVRPFCADPLTCVPPWLNSTLLWLGYANSFLNPIIYA